MVQNPLLKNPSGELTEILLVLAGGLEEQIQIRISPLPSLSSLASRTDCSNLAGLGRPYKVAGFVLHLLTILLVVMSDVEIAHHYAIYLCSLDVEIYVDNYHKQPKGSTKMIQLGNQLMLGCCRRSFARRARKAFAALLFAAAFLVFFSNFFM